MASKDTRVDEYINAAADFAKPVLRHLRKLVHKACPAVEETIKWQFPHFDYKGGFCSMAAFKNHCAFAFWKASLMNDPDQILEREDKTSMGSLGKITSLKDLPPDEVMLAYLANAMQLNDEGKKAPKGKPVAKKELPVPPALAEALGANEKAKTAFEKFSASHRNEYIEWISDAKTEATRNKRINTTITWLQEGKRRNWKYE